MDVGIYFDSARLGAWSWSDFTERLLPLSGTDGQVLGLAKGLADVGIRVTLFAKTLGGAPTGIREVVVGDLAGAVLRAKDDRCDLIVFNNRSDDETIHGVESCEAQSFPCVVWDHNGPNRGMAACFASHSMVRRVVCVSFAQADCARDKPGFEKIQAIHNSADERMFESSHQRAKRNQIVFVGALTGAKGFQHVARCWPGLRRRFRDLRLLVLGSATLYDRDTNLGHAKIASPEFENELSSAFGMPISEVSSEGVEFRGLTLPLEVTRLASESLVGVVNPNCKGSIETFCVSAIEIQAAGTAVIGARAGGLVETVNNGLSGLLVHREADLGDAIAQLVSDPARAYAMGRAGGDWVRSRFGRHRIIQQWITLLSSVMEQRVPVPIPFSTKRANPKTYLREAIRRTRAAQSVLSGFRTRQRGTS